jgi:hypothetical protein
LLARDRAVADWLSKNVPATYDTLKTCRSRALAFGTVKARLDGWRRRGLTPYRVAYAMDKSTRTALIAGV